MKQNSVITCPSCERTEIEKSKPGGFFDYHCKMCGHQFTKFMYRMYKQKQKRKELKNESKNKKVV